MQTSLEHTLTLEAQSRLFTKKLMGSGSLPRRNIRSLAWGTWLPIDRV